MKIYSSIILLLYLINNICYSLETAYYTLRVSNGVSLLDNIHHRMNNELYQSSTVNNTDDSPFQSITLPFNFPFYNELKSTLRISPNGGIHFKTNPPCCSFGSCIFINFFCNLDNSYRDLIAPIITDLYPQFCNPVSATYNTFCNNIESRVEYLVNSNAYTVAYYNVPIYLNSPTQPTPNPQQPRFTFSATLFPSGRIVIRFIDLPLSQPRWFSGLRHATTNSRYTYTDEEIISQYASDWDRSAPGLYAPKSQVIVGGQNRTLTWWPLSDVCMYPLRAPFSGGTKIRFGTSYNNISAILHNDDEFQLKCSVIYGQNIQSPNITIDIIPTLNISTNSLDCIVPPLPLLLRFNHTIKANVRLIIVEKSTNTSIIRLPYSKNVLPNFELTYINDSDVLVSSNIMTNLMEGSPLCEQCSTYLNNDYCRYDCNNDFQGIATFDKCGVCSGGLTNKLPNAALSCDNTCFGQRELINNLCGCKDTISFGLPTSKCFNETGLLPYPSKSIIDSSFCMSSRFGYYNQSINISILSANSLFFNIVNSSSTEIIWKCVFGGRRVGNITSFGVFNTKTNELACFLNLTTSNTVNSNLSIPLRIYYHNDSMWKMINYVFVYSLLSIKTTEQYKNITLTQQQKLCNKCHLNYTKEYCELDCYGELAGNAYLDDCNVCIGGLTGIQKSTKKDCNGFCNGPFNIQSSTCTCPLLNSSVCTSLINNRADKVIQDLKNGKTSPYIFRSVFKLTTNLNPINSYQIIYSTFNDFSSALDKFKSVKLPFSFPFFGLFYRRVYINPQGALHFSTSLKSSLSYPSNCVALQGINSLNNGTGDDNYLKFRHYDNFIGVLLSDYTFENGLLPYPKVEILIQNTNNITICFRDYHLRALVFGFEPFSMNLFSFCVTLTSDGGIFIQYKSAKNPMTNSSIQLWKCNNEINLKRRILVGVRPSQLQNDSTAVQNTSSSDFNTNNIKFQSSEYIDSTTAGISTAEGLSLSSAAINNETTISLCTISSDICISVNSISFQGNTVLFIAAPFFTCVSNLTNVLPSLFCSFGGQLIPSFFDEKLSLLYCTAPSGNLGEVIAFSLTNNESDSTYFWRSMEIALSFVNSTNNNDPFFNQINLCNNCKHFTPSFCLKTCDNKWLNSSYFINKCGQCVNNVTELSIDCTNTCYGAMKEIQVDNNIVCGCNDNTGYYDTLSQNGMPLLGAFRACLYYVVINGNLIASTINSISFLRIFLIIYGILLVLIVPNIIPNLLKNCFQTNLNELSSNLVHSITRRGARRRSGSDINNQQISPIEDSDPVNSIQTSTVGPVPLNNRVNNHQSDASNNQLHNSNANNIDNTNQENNNSIDNNNDANNDNNNINNMNTNTNNINYNTDSINNNINNINNNANNINYNTDNINNNTNNINNNVNNANTTTNNNDNNTNEIETYREEQRINAIRNIL